MDLVKLFWDTFPLSFVILFSFAGFVYWFVIRKREQQDVIQNEVQLFFKGNTVQEFPCEVEKDIAKFKLGENEYREPIIAKPRLRIKKVDGVEKIFRTFMYAEGIGFTDVPPLTSKGREAIKASLINNNIIDAEIINEYDDDELIEFVQFYNFDIEQITDKPMLRAFSTSMNMFASTMEYINKNIRTNQQQGSTIRYLLIGLLFFGFGLMAGLYLATKGYM